MSVHSFVGPAGSGKTTRLMDSLEARLRERPLIEGQRVLAVTRMHGARHRLDERLANGVARGQCDCMTMDRLAWVLAMRWRSRLKELGGTPSSELDFDETCRSAALLLGDNAVSAWLARRYPIVIVDEFQDCRDGRLGIVRALSASCELLLAADDFQDLTGEAGAPAVDWLKTTGNREELEHIHRTDEEQLLGAANALREGRKLSIGWSAGFSLVPAPNANVAASFVARAIRWSAGASLVVLSPTGPARSKFVRDALERLAAKPFEDKRKKGEKPKTFGPYKCQFAGSWAHAFAA
ncbi:MAG: AAA family ATPase [Polyangiaceae bacterium]